VCHYVPLEAIKRPMGDKMGDSFTLIKSFSLPAGMLFSLDNVLLKGVIRKFYSWMEYISKFVVLIHRTYFYHMNSLTHYDHL